MSVYVGLRSVGRSVDGMAAAGMVKGQERHKEKEREGNQ